MFLLSLLPMVLAAQTDDARRSHAYAFDQPEVLAAQRVFGIGNAVTMLGVACADDSAATASYAQWQIVNGDMLKKITLRLADYYRISSNAGDLQQRVAATMHLKSQISLSESALADACSSLPETLALPSMDLTKRYQAVLLEVKNPDYLKQKRAPLPESKQAPEPAADNDEREEQARPE